MSSDRDDGRRHGGGADGTAGQGGEPSPGRGGSRLDELRARMRAIESEARRTASLRQEAVSGDRGQRRGERDPRVGEADTADGADTADADSREQGPVDDSLPDRAGQRTAVGLDPAPGFRRGHRSGSKHPSYEAIDSAQTEEPVEPECGGADLSAGLRPGKSRNGREHAFDPEPAAVQVQAGATAQAPSATAPSSLDPVPEDPADEAYTPLFDQSLSSPSRRERRRGVREQTATQRALGLLTRREHSRKELTRKLTSRGLDRDEVVAAVDRLADAGWQNDTRFADSLVRSRAGNGYGPLHIRAELSLHGLDSEAVAQALDRYEGDWLDNARDLVRRRFGEGHYQDPALRRKAADLLMRRGFGGETARNANRSCPED